MSKLEPLYLAPPVGFATWHLEHGESVPQVLERLRMHCDYCTLSGDEIRACVRRALSDLKRWQNIRHCAGWRLDGGACSWDECLEEQSHVEPRTPADQTGDTDRGCNGSGGRGG